MFEFEKRFTETYRENLGRSTARREAECLKVQFPYLCDDIRENDLFAGRLRYPAVYFSPHAGEKWDVLLYHCEFYKFEEVIQSDHAKESDKAAARDLLEFWKQENTKAKVIAGYTEDMRNALTRDIYTEPSVCMTAFRIAGAYLDYDKLLGMGINGLDNLLQTRMRGCDGRAKDLYEAMQSALSILKSCCDYYAAQAQKMAEAASGKRKARLLAIANSMSHIKERPPETFHQAVQLSWLYSLVSGVSNYGRMDDYLGNFLVSDLNHNRITREEALELLKSLWIIINDRQYPYCNRIIIGGKGRKNEKNADVFALLAMEATDQVAETTPQLSLRFYEGMSEDLLKKAYDVIGNGRTFPLLYNDDVNVKAVSAAFGIPEKMAEDYVMFGCGEYVINHKSIGTPSGGGNLTEAVILALFNGFDPGTGEKLGLETGIFSDFQSFEDFFAAYQKQLEYFLDMNGKMEALEYKAANENAALLFYSILYDDCIERGRAILDGGVYHLGGTYEAHGVTNASDSLAAVKKAVFEEKVIGADTLTEAIKNNFKGYERERSILLNCPKYGNDEEEADEMMCRVHNHLCNYLRQMHTRLPLDSYMAVNINNDHNTRVGIPTCASPDGRLAAQPLANANNPSPGMDKNGVTAFLNSLVKIAPDIHAGYVQNMKFSKSWFEQDRGKFETLMRTYFKNGGTQAMITVLNREDLANAMERPWEYSSLMVRVGGFSAKFVELPKEVQTEIYSRTLY